MPAIVLLLIPILGEEATIALFVSLCRFAMAATPFFEALTDNIGPAAPARSAAARVITDGASSTFISSGARSAGSLITAAYERSLQYWRPHVGAHQLTPEQLREALQVVKQCGKNEQRVTDLVRRAAQQQHPHPPEVHIPMGGAGNLVRNAVTGNPKVNGFLMRNFVTIRQPHHGGPNWEAVYRINGIERVLGEIDVVHQRNPDWLITKITELMRAAQIVVH